MFDYLLRIGDCLSQIANVVFLNGHPNESISGRSYRKNWNLARLIDFFLGKGHCKEAYYNDISYAAKVLTRHRQSNGLKRDKK